MSAAPLQPGQLLANKYRLEKLLGRGGMGAVFLAENVAIKRKVAVKVLHSEYTSHPEMFARFRQEAQAASTIGHPGVVDVLDLGLAEGVAFIVMEHLQGETLRELLDREKRLSLEETARIFGELLDCLGMAHEKGVIHRDLKPENIFLVKPSGTVKVLDFGLSKFRAEDLTSAGRIFGTPHYMAPEQARSSRDVGPASDLYAVGALLFHALAGEPPFDAPSALEILSKSMNKPAPALASLRSDVPATVASLVSSLLGKSPAERPADARLVREALLKGCASRNTFSHQVPQSAFDDDLAEATVTTVAISSVKLALVPPDDAPCDEDAPTSLGAPLPRQQPSNRKFALAVGAVLFLVAEVAYALVVLRRDPEPVGDIPPQVLIKAAPEEARWFVKGTPLGCNECLIDQSVSTRVVVVARAEGYQERAVQLPVPSETVTITLTRARTK